MSMSKELEEAIRAKVAQDPEHLAGVQKMSAKDALTRVPGVTGHKIDSEIRGMFDGRPKKERG